MKRLSRILPFLLAAALYSVPSQAQSQDGSISGRVIGRDGTTPVQGALVYIDSLVTQNGRVQVRERLQTKTGRDGRYSMTGLYVGRVRVTVVENDRPVMMKGEAIGDEIYLATGVNATANFDLSKAPAAPPPVAADAPPPTSNISDKEREALRKKYEEEAAAAGVMTKAFEEAKAAFTAKNYDDAVTKFKSAIDKIPNPAPPGVADVIWANLAKTYDAMKNWPESAAAYEKAIEFKPTESNYHLNLSLAFIAMGELTKSEAAIKKAAELNPANAGMAYYNMGATLVNRNQPNEAIMFFKKAIEQDPKYANAHFQLGLSLIGIGKMAEAQPVLQEYLKLVPTGQDADTAKALIEATKNAGPTEYKDPAATKSPAPGKQPASTKGKTN
jgi:tetratricopeptide (TPR) repeat protein